MAGLRLRSHLLGSHLVAHAGGRARATCASGATRTDARPSAPAQAAHAVAISPSFFRWASCRRGLRAGVRSSRRPGRRSRRKWRQRWLSGRSCSPRSIGWRRRWSACWTWSWPSRASRRVSRAWGRQRRLHQPALSSRLRSRRKAAWAGRAEGLAPRGSAGARREVAEGFARRRSRLRLRQQRCRLCQRRGGPGVCRWWRRRGGDAPRREPSRGRAAGCIPS